MYRGAGGYRRIRLIRIVSHASREGKKGLVIQIRKETTRHGKLGYFQYILLLID